ncbi:hypothetical protein FEM48_Zijuj12G0106900 [Ziziphus jujuba var. spinosa]|uniref:Uncharacterized protein n=1 Tax=Ziziphus jujuba var. spinosa TaxID=714518 RepID=A0A978UCU7_ZIZJJ|nr:hypothetical protein FEM48_Zijuj12G0106900 [Ziziphus jujuba var. spinosa]
MYLHEHTLSIWIDKGGYIAEGPSSNVASITHDKDPVIPCFDTILTSCTAKRLIELAPKLVKQGVLKGMRIGYLNVEEAKGAAEMMHVGSSLPLLPIIVSHEKPIGHCDNWKCSKSNI